MIRVGLPYIDFFINLIWLTGIVVIVFLILHIIRRAMAVGETIYMKAADFILGLADTFSIFIWVIIFITLLQYLLLQATYQEVFDLILGQLLPVYIAIICFKFAAYNLANRTMEEDSLAD